MVIQVFSGEKPAVPRRAMLASIFLLVAASVCAAMLSWIRSSRSLYAPLRPPGWSLAVQPPVEFARAEFRSLPGLGMTLLFERGTSRDDRVTILICRLQRGQQASGDAVGAALKVYRTLLTRQEMLVGSLPYRWDDRTLGSAQAVELWDAMLQIMIRAAIAPDGDAYAACLLYGGSVSSRSAYRAFAELCKSATFKP